MESTKCGGQDTMAHVTHALVEMVAHVTHTSSDVASACSTFPTHINRFHQKFSKELEYEFTVVKIALECLKLKKANAS